MSVLQPKIKKTLSVDKIVMDAMSKITQFFNRLAQAVWCKKIALALLVSSLYYLQHRFWLFPAIYEDMGGNMGGDGDAYYNLALMMQNTVNLSNGEFYSLQGDHYTFYSNIIGVTAHNYAPSLIYALLYIIFQQPILAFNLIFFGNLFLTQVGLFFLVRYYTKNNLIAFFAGFLFPLSEAVKTFYVGHIHASYYWALPFWTLFAEILLNSQLRLKSWKSWLLCFGLFGTTLWLVMAEWHVFTFSVFWMGAWILFKVKFLWQCRKTYIAQIGVFVSIIILNIIILLPLALNYLHTSKIFNSVRTPINIVNTNFATENFYGSKFVIKNILDTTNSFVDDESFSKKLSNVSSGINTPGLGYPDPLYSASFWLGLISFLPLLWITITSKSKELWRWILYLSIFLFVSLLAIGPVVNIASNRVDFPLLHYFVYQIFPPLAAIRATWRINVVGFMALLVLWSLVLSKAWQFMQLKLSPLTIKNKLIVSTKLVKVFFVGYSVILLFSLAVFVNGGWRANSALVAEQHDEDLSSMLNQLADNKSKSIFFLDSDQEKSYFVSYHNLKQGYFQLNWVSGGIAGVYPSDLGMFNSLFFSLGNYKLGVEGLASKKVDLVVENKNFSMSSEEEQKLHQELYIYYNLASETENYRVWTFEKTANHLSDWRSLNYFLTLSKFQTSGEKWFFKLNFENLNKVLYVNPDKVNITDFRLEFWQGGEKRDEQKVQMGEKAIILPNIGFGYNFITTPNNLNNIQTTVKLFKEEEQIYEQIVEVLSSKDYWQKVEEAKVAKLSISDTQTELTSEYLNFLITKPWLSIPVLPVKAEMDINSGVLQNYPKKHILENNHKISVWFYNSENEKYVIPGWAFQPDCDLQGNYFQGDRLSFWCEQHLPIGGGYPYIGVVTDKDR